MVCFAATLFAMYIKVFMVSYNGDTGVLMRLKSTAKMFVHWGVNASQINAKMLVQQFFQTSNKHHTFALVGLCTENPSVTGGSP